MAFGKVLRTVETEVELTHIASVIGVGKTAGDTLGPLRLYVSPVVAALVVEQQGIHIVIAERLGVGDIGLEIGAVVAVFSA